MLFGAVEDRQQAVILLGGERVRLVIVASGAADRHAEEDRAHRGNDIVELVRAVLGDRGIRSAHVVVVARAIAAKAGGDQTRFARFIDLVAGELLGHELGIGLVLVETADDVIAVFPGVGAVQVVARSRCCRRSGPGRANAFPTAHHRPGLRGGGR